MNHEALRLFRVFHDLKLYELAEKLEISPSYLSEIENGKKQPSLEILQRYANTFHTKPSTILSFSEYLDKNSKEIKATIAKTIISFLQDIESESKK